MHHCKVTGDNGITMTGRGREGELVDEGLCSGDHF